MDKNIWNSIITIKIDRQTVYKNLCCIPNGEETSCKKSAVNELKSMQEVDE